MKKLDTTIVVIDDDINFKRDPFIVEAREFFKDVRFFDIPQDAIKYISENLEKRLIVILDLLFPSNEPTGNEILKTIRESTFLIPVIIWSGVDEAKWSFPDLINNNAFAYLKKGASSAEIIAKLFEANTSINNDISSALESWIEANSEKDREAPYMLTVDGRTLSLNDILNEVRMQTPEGIEFSKKLTTLTIDLLARNKESLNG